MPLELEMLNAGVVLPWIAQLLNERITVPGFVVDEEPVAISMLSIVALADPHPTANNSGAAVRNEKERMMNSFRFLLRTSERESDTARGRRA